MLKRTSICSEAPSSFFEMALINLQILNDKIQEELYLSRKDVIKYAYMTKVINSIVNITKFARW